MTNRPPNQPRWMITLIAIWLILQCFDYTLLDPIFTVNLGVSVTPDRFVFLLVLGSYVIASASFSTRAKRITGLELLMILFSVYCLVSWFISGADFVLTKSRWLSTLFTLCFQPFAAYFIASRLPYDRSHIRTLISVLAAIGVYLGLTGIFEHYSISPLVFPKYILDPSVGIQFERARGPFASSVINGGALLVCFLALAFRAAVSTGGKRTVYFLLTIPVCITIYFTDTRSIWLAFAFVLALLAVTRSSMRATAVRVIALAALLFISGVGSKFSFFEQTLFGRRSETVDYRFVNMDTAINMFADNPVFGIGYGNFTRQWRRYFVDKYDTVPDLTDGNHSTLFGILAELGAIGIVLYSAILLGGLKAVVTLLRSLRDENRSFEKRFVLVTLGIWISFLVIGVTSDLRFHQLLNVVLFLFLGLVTSIATAFQQPSRRPEPTEP